VTHGADVLVVGLDVGGTSTRALVADLDGNHRGRGTASGGNPNSHPPEQAAAQVGKALREALTGLDPAGVRAGMLGMAGVSTLTDPAVRALFEQAWHEAGLRCPLRVASDCEVGFAAGAAERSGTALVAGTGSIAARIQDHRMVATVGGHGWLLGDEGSGFWLGREAVRAALRALEGRLPLTGLTEAVLTRALGTPPEGGWPGPDHRSTSSRLITVVNRAEPIALAGYAALVTTTAAEGDEVARDIVRRAAEQLLDLVAAARPSGGSTPVVLIGSLTAPDNPVGAALRAQLAVRYGEDVVRTATDGAAGAAWLAALDLLDEPAAAALHTRLTAG